MDQPRRHRVRGDGKIVASVSLCLPARVRNAHGLQGRLVRRRSRRANGDAAEALGGGGACRPTQSRPLPDAGSTRGRRVARPCFAESVVSPWSSGLLLEVVVRHFTSGSVCGGKYTDTFVISSRRTWRPSSKWRACRETTPRIRGTAATATSSASSSTTPARPTHIWHPIGPPSTRRSSTTSHRVGPAGSGNLRPSPERERLAATPRAHAVVSWDRVPLLANFTQSDYYLSPTERDQGRCSSATRS